MDCFTLKGKGQIGRGIMVSGHRNNVVHLGVKRGRDGTTQRVRLCRVDPAEVEATGLVLKAEPLKLPLREATGNFFYVLAKPSDRHEDRVLVHINTRRCYAPASCGKYEIVQGKPEIIAEAFGHYFNFGDHLAGWVEALIIMAPGDVIRVKPEGKRRAAPYALICTLMGLHTKPYVEYEKINNGLGDALSPKKKRRRGRRSRRKEKGEKDLACC